MLKFLSALILEHMGLIPCYYERGARDEGTVTWSDGWDLKLFQPLKLIKIADKDTNGDAW